MNGNIHEMCVIMYKDFLMELQLKQFKYYDTGKIVI